MTNKGQLGNNSLQKYKDMKIKDVIQEFVGTSGYSQALKASSVSINLLGDKLYSYGTVICQKVITKNSGILGESLIINLTKYSATTSKHQNWLKNAWRSPAYKGIYFVDNVPKGANSLVEYCQEYQK